MSRPERTLRELGKLWDRGALDVAEEVHRDRLVDELVLWVSGGGTPPVRATGSTHAAWCAWVLPKLIGT